MKINGKVAVIIGGAQGIGRACAEALLRRGAKVCIGDIQREKGRQVTDELATIYGLDSVEFVNCDIRSREDIAELFKEATSKLGTVEILCPAAGIVHEGEWGKCIDVNLKGAIQSTYIAMDYMSKTKGGNGGVVIYMSSALGVTGSASFPAYSASKHGVIGFMRSWAEKENANLHGIRFNALCPTIVDTDLIRQLAPDECYHYDALMNGLPFLALLPASAVAEVFVQCVEEDDFNGRAFKLSCEAGKECTDLIEFPAV